MIDNDYDSGGDDGGYWLKFMWWSVEFPAIPSL